MFINFKIMNTTGEDCKCCGKFIGPDKKYLGVSNDIFFQLCKSCTKQLAQFLSTHIREVQAM